MAPTRIFDKPKIEFDTAINYSFDSPFTLNGKPMTNPPQVVKNTFTEKSIEYFNKNNGGVDYRITFSTEHILAPDQETTLRAPIENSIVNFNYQFACIHQGLWNQDVIELSIVFLNGNANVYHINVPILFAEDGIDENIFLSSWLYEGNNKRNELPRGFTFNQILRVNSTTKDKTRVAVHTYTNVIRGGNAGDEKREMGVTNYTLCIFKDPVKVQRKLMTADWFTKLKIKKNEIPDATKSSFTPYQPRTFPEILQIMMPNLFNWTPPANGASPNITFTTPNTLTINPIYYYLDLKGLLGSGYRTSSSKGKLENVKCYPIDIATQVNDDGSVNLDTTGLRATSVTKESDVGKSKYTGLSAEDSNYYIRIFAIAVIVFLSLLAIIAIVVVFFAGGARKEAMKKAVQQLTTEKASLRAGFPPTQATIT